MGADGFALPDNQWGPGVQGAERKCSAGARGRERQPEKQSVHASAFVLAVPGRSQIWKLPDVCFLSSGKALRQKQDTSTSHETASNT